MQAKSFFHQPPFPVSEDEYGYWELSTGPVAWGPYPGWLGFDKNKDPYFSVPRFLTLTLVVLL